MYMGCKGCDKTIGMDDEGYKHQESCPRKCPSCYKYFEVFISEKHISECKPRCKTCGIDNIDNIKTHVCNNKPGEYFYFGRIPSEIKNK